MQHHIDTDLDVSYQVPSEHGADFQRLADHQGHWHPCPSGQKVWTLCLSWKNTSPPLTKSCFQRNIRDMLSIWLKEIWLIMQESSVEWISGVSALHGKQGNQDRMKTELGVESKEMEKRRIMQSRCVSVGIQDSTLCPTQHSYPCWDAPSSSVPRASRQDLLQASSQPWTSVMSNLSDPI